MCKFNSYHKTTIVHPIIIMKLIIYFIIITDYLLYRTHKMSYFVPPCSDMAFEFVNLSTCTFSQYNIFDGLEIWLGFVAVCIISKLVSSLPQKLNYAFTKI